MDQHVSPHIDYTRLSRLVLGRHWSKASAEQRDAFITELRHLITRSYSAAVPQLVGAKVAYRAPRVSKDGERIAVRTQVKTRDGARLDVNYLMYNADGKWRVFDLSIEGVSLLTTYRRSFAAHMRNGTLDTLIEHMQGLNSTS